MCWFSSESAESAFEARAGERLVVREMHGFWNWLVRENDAKTAKPSPVCLLDKTQVIFRPEKAQGRALRLSEPDCPAEFRMDRVQRRDLFLLEDGRELDINRLPPGLVLDVIHVPEGGRGTFSVSESALELTGHLAHASL